MLEACRELGVGQVVFTSTIAVFGPGLPEVVPDDAPLHERLSHREYQVFRLLAEGRSVGEIAEQLVLSPNTVSTYRARILEKTGVRNDVELALYAVRQEIV